jgi:hypothetical protein
VIYVKQQTITRETTKQQQQTKERFRSMVHRSSRIEISPLPETRYANIELECLADHRPLIPILYEYSLDKLDNPRLLRLRLKMARYNFTARWVPGNRNIQADALSRSPISRGVASDELGEGPQSFTARVAVVGIIAESPDIIVDATLEKVRWAVAADPVLTALRATVLERFPNDKCNLPLAIRSF